MDDGTTSTPSTVLDPGGSSPAGGTTLTDPRARAAPGPGGAPPSSAAAAAAPPSAAGVPSAPSSASHSNEVAAELQGSLDKLQGRAVLLVLQRDGQDVPVRRVTSLFNVLAQIVPQAAAATLVFRGPDEQGRDHFQVLHSADGGLPVGAAYADPRKS